MTAMYIILPTVWIAANAFFMRNQRVYSERTRILNRVLELTRADMENGRLSGDLIFWRYDIFKSISYDRMMYTFWKPVRSFFPPVEEWVLPHPVMQ